MRLNKLYNEDIKHTSALELPWEKLCNSSVLITGASGLIGTYLIDVLMNKNISDKLNCKIYAVVRDTNKAEQRFSDYIASENFRIVAKDINSPVSGDLPPADYIVHLASNTHPMAYSTDPIGTISTNIIGTNNLLKFAADSETKRFVFASSNEIYGENRGDCELFDENYCGYINSNTMRAGYPESKRCGEALCQAYIHQAGIDAVIPRLTRSYGPTLLSSDTKALSQFLKKGLLKENIVLKSAGEQYYSYTYVADAVSGLLTVMLCGECGEAYNIADEKSDVKLKTLAAIIAEYAGTQVVFEIPDAVESAGYSTATKARLDGSKLKKLGWSAEYDIKSGIYRTLDIMSE